MHRSLAILSALLILPASASAQWSRTRGTPWHWQMAVSDAVSTRTASRNVPIDGEFRTVAVQASKALFRWRSVTFAWLAEVQPAIVVQAGAPAELLPTLLSDPNEAGDTERRARYAVRDGFGVGLAPLGAEASMPLNRSTKLLLNVTAGAAWFNQAVPYGKATQANFTVAPGIGVERAVGSRSALAVGYALHHLSNASMGDANPGMNSHLLFFRVARRSP